MKYWINKDSAQFRTFTTAQQFFGVEVDLPDNLAEAMVEFETKWKEYQDYLRKIEGQLALRNPNIDIMETVEVPEWLDNTRANSGGQPKRKGIGLRSSKKSQQPQKREDTDLLTSRKNID